MELQSTWTWLPAIYLFLGGMSAGCMLSVALLRLAKPGRFSKTIAVGTWVSVIGLAAGLVALVAEVEKPFQAVIMFKSFVNPMSWMTIGAWILFVSFFVFALFAVFSTPALTSRVGFLGRAAKRGSAVFAALSIPFAVGVAVYTGILLSAAPAIPLWDTWLLPALFTVSAFDTGVAAVIIVLVFVEKDESATKIKTLFEGATVVLVAIEAAVLSVFMSTMAGGSLTQAMSASVITEGELSVAFWGLIVAVGLAVPFIAAVSQLFMARKGVHSVWISTAGSACALAGGFALRYIILVAGVHAAIMSPMALQAVQGVFYMVG